MDEKQKHSNWKAIIQRMDLCPLEKKKDILVVDSVQITLCLRMCVVKWSERENALKQSLQWNGLSPVCFRMWRVSSSDLAKRHEQPSHLHSYGFSPEQQK
ncbi:hypothetical protein T03_4062 [Trichinella britovi]|uniref:Uncharacterized protein n=1 Tax=Trichinella britovi TaxID=45882 RepID=A0A0V1DFA1_TRIBR|nr:hypothetical protein T03_4062 [Trichinella britovi]